MFAAGVDRIELGTPHGVSVAATGIDWTAEGKERIAEKEYRYISAVFSYYQDTGEVLEIISVALTNTPGIDGLDPLTQRAAMSRSTFLTTPFTSTKDDDMDKDQQIAALTAERDALKPQAAQVVQANTKVVGNTCQSPQRQRTGASDQGAINHARHCAASVHEKAKRACMTFRGQEVSSEAQTTKRLASPVSLATTSAPAPSAAPPRLHPAPSATG